MQKATTPAIFVSSELLRSFLRRTAGPGEHDWTVTRTLPAGGMLALGGVDRPTTNRIHLLGWLPRGVIASADFQIAPACTRFRSSDVARVRRPCRPRPAARFPPDRLPR